MNWHIPVFMRTRLNIEPYSPLKPTKVGFIFIGPNSLSRAEVFNSRAQTNTLIWHCHRSLYGGLLDITLVVTLRNVFFDHLIKLF